MVYALASILLWIITSRPVLGVASYAFAFWDVAAALPGAMRRLALGGSFFLDPDEISLAAVPVSLPKQPRVTVKVKGAYGSVRSQVSAPMLPNAHLDSRREANLEPMQALEPLIAQSQMAHQSAGLANLGAESRPLR